MPQEQLLKKLWQKGCEFLGTQTAILAGAMTWVSNHKLVSAISNADGFGVIACGSMTPRLLSNEIATTYAMTDKPFGVNLITMHPELETLIDVCGQQQVRHVILAGGLPQTVAIQRLKDLGCKVISFAPTVVIAKKLIRAGIDALIIEGSEAGGHIGPVSTSVLVQEILPFIQEVPIFVAGGIGRGETMVNYLRMGAAGCQLGTRFVCATESPAHQNFKKAFIRAQARDAILSIQLDPRFPVIPVRALANPATEHFIKFQSEVIQQYDAGEIDFKQAQLKIEHFWAGALRKAAIDGDTDNGSLMAGQSVGLITKEQAAQEIINELIDQANNFLLVQ